MNSTVANELSSLVEGLLRWTCLLASAWILHGLLRRQHPRGRVILWRVVLLLTLVLPWWPKLQVPAFSVSIPRPMAQSLGFPIEKPAAIAQSIPSAYPPPLLLPRTATTEPSVVIDAGPSREFHWPQSVFTWLALVWVLGSLSGALRLAHWHYQLHRLGRASIVVGPNVAATVAAVGAQLGLRGPIETRVSSQIRSPFIYGFWRPRLLLPEPWLRELSAPDITALLRHEIAHIRGQDLRWAIAWRWLATVAWIQPLAWFVPRVHQLACEQEADRLAAGSANQRGEYAALLARLALQVLALPRMETKLALNASSELVRRLNHLAKGEPRPWHRRHLVLAGIGAALVFLLGISWRFSVADLAGDPNQSANTFAQVQVTVLTVDGRPIPGAVIQPDGLRHHQNPASHYTWQPALHGTPQRVTTDARGEATISYPKLVIPAEKLRTIQISFSVNHPDYSPARHTEYPVKGSASPVRLNPGVPIEVSAYYGPNREPVIELIPNLSGETKPNWQDQSTGHFICEQQSPGGKLLQVMGRLPGGEIAFSDTVSFTAEVGQPSRHNLELKPGIRLKGRVDSLVPRPVRNGRVVIGVRPKEFPALEPNQLYTLRKQYGNFHFWSSYRTIDAEGNFVFESIPPGEVDVIVHGDGFCSRPGRLLSTNYVAPKGFGIPQKFPLVTPMTEITVVTESTATIRLTAKTRSGEPLEGAKIYFNPNVLLIPAGLFGEIRRAGEAPFRTIPKLPPMPYQITTDDVGVAVAENLPAFISGFDLDHPDFEVPISPGAADRYVRFERALEPGATRSLNITVQPKGGDLLGNQ